MLAYLTQDAVAERNNLLVFVRLTPGVASVLHPVVVIDNFIAVAGD